MAEVEIRTGREFAFDRWGRFLLKV